MNLIALLFFISIIAFLIWLDYYIAFQFYTIAVEKGYPDKKYLKICFLLFIIGYLLVIALPDRGTPQMAATNDSHRI